MGRDVSVMMPELGEGVMEGELQKWKVAIGDSVKEDDVVAEVMTDKASVEIPSTHSGVVKELKAKEGQTCPVGNPLLILEADSKNDQKQQWSHKRELSADSKVDSRLRGNDKLEGNGSSRGNDRTSEKDSKGGNDKSKRSDDKKSEFVDVVSKCHSREGGNPAKSTGTVIENAEKHCHPYEDNNPASTDNKSDSQVLATPIVRKTAKDHSIDLSTIKGTGLSGRITLEDIQKLIPKKSPKNMTVSSHVPSGFSIPVVTGLEERKPFKGIRKKIAVNMQTSKNLIPHFTLMEQASVEELFRLRMEAKKLYPDVKITYLSFVMKTLYNSLQEFPELNASIDDHSEEIVYKKYFHFGFAADTPKGLLVPVIKDINKKSVLDISREIVELSEKARNTKLTLEEMKNATITITNIGSISGQWATPIINPPEVSILGMYRMFERPVWNGNSFQPVKTMNFSLTSDHRLIDGAVAARFMSDFVKRIENPSLILIDT